MMAFIPGLAHAQSTEQLLQYEVGRHLDADRQSAGLPGSLGASPLGAASRPRPVTVFVPYAVARVPVYYGLVPPILPGYPAWDCKHRDDAERCTAWAQVQ